MCWGWGVIGIEKIYNEGNRVRKQPERWKKFPSFVQKLGLPLDPL